MSARWGSCNEVKMTRALLWINYAVSLALLALMVVKPWA